MRKHSCSYVVHFTKAFCPVCPPRLHTGISFSTLRIAAIALRIFLVPLSHAAEMIESASLKCELRILDVVENDQHARKLGITHLFADVCKCLILNRHHAVGMHAQLVECKHRIVGRSNNIVILARKDGCSESDLMGKMRTGDCSSDRTNQ